MFFIDVWGYVVSTWGKNACKTQWHHMRDNTSIHRQLNYLFGRSFRVTTKNTRNLRISSLCETNPRVMTPWHGVIVVSNLGPVSIKRPSFYSISVIMIRRPRDRIIFIMGITTWSETHFRQDLFPAYLFFRRQFHPIVIFRFKSISDLDSGSLPRYFGEFIYEKLKLVVS